MEVGASLLRNLRSRGKSQVLWNRVPTWKKLYHPNVLQFRGVNVALLPLALVYDWGQNGNVIEYVTLHPRAPRPILVGGSPITTARETLINLTFIARNE